MKIVPLTLDYTVNSFDCGDSDLMDKLKMLLKNEASHSAFRYITVDAYISAIPFYLKNGFVELTKKEEDEHTKLMYFDMMELE